MAKSDYFEWAGELFSFEEVFSKPEALVDIKIVEFCTLILGPSTPAYLTEFGATVFKVELPGMGTPCAPLHHGAGSGKIRP